MKIILEEYGEVLLAMIGAVGVIGASLFMLWNQVANQVTYVAAGL